MKYLHLTWAGIWRKPGRTSLTFLTIVNAFVLLGLLIGFSGGLAKSMSDTRADALFVANRLSQLEPLPVSMATDIAVVPGVQETTPIILFQSTYRTPSQVIRAYAVKPDAFFRMSNSTVTLPPAQLEALSHTRDGAVVSADLARQYGWKIGDRIPLNSSFWANRDGSRIWPVEIVGIYQMKVDDVLLGNAMMVNYDFVDQGRAIAGGTASLFLVKTKDANQAGAVGRAIDGVFANSSHETETVSERQLAEGQLKQIGDIGLVIRAIVAAVFCALLLSIGAVMMQSIRERTPELAILKTLGFTDGGVIGLVVAETALICLAPAAIGLLIARMMFPWIAHATGFNVTAGEGLAAGIAAALILAAITGMAPAARSGRLKIVDALAGR